MKVEHNHTERAPGRKSTRLEIAVVSIFCLLLLQGLVWASDFLIPVTAACLYPVTAFETARQFCLTRVFGSS